MATWKKVVVSGSAISQLNNDAGYITSVTAQNAFTTASVNGTNILAAGSNSSITFASSSGAGLNLSAAGTTLTMTLGSIPNSSLANSTISGIALGSNLANHTAGAGLFGTTYTGATSQTWTVDSGSMLPYYSSSIFAKVSGDITITAAGAATIANGAVPLSGAEISGWGAGVQAATQVATGSAGGFVGYNQAYGTPTSITLTNGTGLPISTGVSGLGTGVATALGNAVGGAGSFVVNGGVLGTPSSGTLTNATGLPISTGLTGAGAGVLNALAVATGSAGAFVVNGGALGTPSSGTLTNATGLPISTGVSGLGTSVATALGTNVGSAGAFVVNGGALGTPSSGTLTNATGLPVSTGISGLGAGVATFLATPSSANLASALTDETGTAGSVVFSAGPTLTGTTNVANLAASGNVTIAGNLNVSGLISGSATIISATNVAVTDQFILLASGSTSTIDAGIIVQNAAAAGEAFYWENNVTGTSRWAIASGVSPTATTVTAAEYNVSVATAAGAPSGNPTYGGATYGFGQMYVNSSNGDIYIFS